MFDQGPANTSERNLWASVLMIAVEDATLGVPSGGTVTKKDLIRQTQEARDYLTTPSRDLSIVCTNAGLDMIAVIEAMRARLKDAPTPEQLIAMGKCKAKPKPEPKERKPKRIPFRNQLFTFNGETRTAQEWCDQTGIALGTAQSRINQSGWPAEQALTTKIIPPSQCGKQGFGFARPAAIRKPATNPEPKPRSNKTILYEHNGEALSITEWSARTGINHRTIRSRLSYGWSIGEALSEYNCRTTKIVKLNLAA